MFYNLKRLISLLVYLDNVIKWNATDGATLTSLSTLNTCKVMAARDEGCVAFGSIAYLAGFSWVYLVLRGLLPAELGVVIGTLILCIRLDLLPDIDHV